MTQPIRPPSKLRLAGFAFLAVYPLVTFGLMLIIPLTPGWPLALRTLILVPIVVVAMIWVIIPTIHKRLHRWL